MSKKVIIVGGVAAGATTAARLRRLDETAEIIMIERGEDISFANCGLPYYVGDVIQNRDNLLVQTPQGMSQRFDLDIRTRQEVQRIIPAEKAIEVRNLRNETVYRETYDYLVLSPGAKPIVPDFPGVDKRNVFTVRNIPDSDFIRHYIEVKDVEKAVVVGGGFIGLEMAEMLDHREIDITIVEAGPQVMNALDPEMAAIVHNYISFLGIDLILNDRPLSLEGEDNVVQVVLTSGKKIDTDMVILGIGVRPEVWLAEQAGLALGSTGGIMVDEYMRTSDPYIYAAGDAVQIRDYQSGQDALVPLAGPANRQGWIIANNIAGRELKYPGSQGTGIVKFKNLTIAMTGKNEKHLQRMGWDYMVCHIHPNSHATYYPGATQMTLKLLFAPKDGKVLGAQIVGYDGVDKRIDVLATAIHAGLTVFDLQELELAYAPPFSSAKDPVNMAAYVAGNMVRGDVEVAYWQDVEDLVKNGAYLLDVRTKPEVERGMVPGAHHIPLDDLRENLDKLPQDKEIIAYCQVSLRSYIANRILQQHGFKVKNISGGYKLYSS
ncbi:MAG: FAD-dependent pyridine nucleotide-disulfide oxidoreductase, partial [Firmicutes bacterium]|nr:FAD-dependent pyridine nucleotide-disulfide oxidoreductase [Bacillota bacterium]